MSFVRTLAKVAAGVVVAKAVKGMVSGAQGGGAPPPRRSSTGGGLDDLLGQVLGGKGGASGGSLQDMLGQVLAGRGGPSTGSADSSLGAQLEKLSRMSRPGGGAASTKADGGSFGRKLNQSLEHFGEPDQPPSRDEEELAGVLLRAMIQAAKADGRIDAGEKSRLLERLGDVRQEELDFVNAELRRDTSPADLARSVPAGAEQQVYMLSAMAIDLDQNSEARYLHDLARSLQLNEATVNAIHDRLQLPRLYR